MNRMTLPAILALTVVAFIGACSSDAQAGHRHHHRGYGYGYYAQPYATPWGYNSAYYGHGYWYRNPFYSHGTLYGYYGGYRPSYSYGLYNSPAFVAPVDAPCNTCNSATLSYDYAPYAYVRPATVMSVGYAPAYIPSSAYYGSYGYGSVGCGCGN